MLQGGSWEQPPSSSSISSSSSSSIGTSGKNEQCIDMLVKTGHTTQQFYPDDQESNEAGIIDEPSAVTNNIQSDIRNRMFQV